WRLSEAARRQGKPPVVFLSVDMKKYAEVSQRVMAIIRGLAPVVEEAGIDEAYADLSFAGSYEHAEEVCLAIKKEILSRERLTASVGIGPNKLIAKIASNEKKPDGLTVVREEEAEAFLEPLPVRKIPGIGPKTEAELVRLGIRLVRDLKRLSRNADFETHTRAYTITQPADSVAALEFEAWKLLLPFLDRRENPKRKPIRLIGVRIEKLQ